MLTKDCLYGEVKPGEVLIYLLKGETYFYTCVLSRNSIDRGDFQDYLLMNSAGTFYWYSRNSIVNLFRKVI